MRLNREIIRLSVPAIVSNVTVPLLGLSDTAISGHLGSASFIGAIAIGTMVFNLIYWMCGFLRMGTTGLTAQAFGRNSHEECVDVLAKSFWLAILIGIGVMLFQYPVCEGLLVLVGAEREVDSLARAYFNICIWSAPLVLATMSISGWFLGMQNTVLPMIISIGINVLNIALSFWFVFGLEWGFRGVALGTLVANVFGFFLSLALLRGFNGNRFPRLNPRCLFGGSDLRRFFTVNVDIFFRSALMVGVSLAVTAIGARIGSVTLAVNAVMVQFFLFFSYFMDGLAFCGEALSGRFAGEGNKLMFRKSVRLLLCWSAAFAVLFFLIYLFWSQDIVGLITDSPDVEALFSDYRVWTIMLPPLSVLAFIYDGFYIGITATRKLLWSTLIATTSFFLISFVHPYWGMADVGIPTNHVLWAGFMSYLFLRGFILALWSPKTFTLKHTLPC